MGRSYSYGDYVGGDKFTGDKIVGNKIMGDWVTVHGRHNVGTIKNQAATNSAAIQELVAAAEALRNQVGGDDRAVIDQSLETIGAGDGVEQGRLRRALGQLGGVAMVVGDVGAPVIDAVRKVMAAFGL